MLRNTAIVVILITTCLCIFSCQDGLNPKPSRQLPRIVVDFDAGMPADRTTRSSGVRMAVWDYGVVLFGTDEMHSAKDVQVGQLSAAELAEAWKAVRESGLTSHPDVSYVVPDSSSVKVVIQDGERTHTHSLSNYRWANVMWWPDAKAALAKFRPGTSKSAELAIDGTFRGYFIK